MYSHACKKLKIKKVKHDLLLHCTSSLVTIYMLHDIFHLYYNLKLAFPYNSRCVLTHLPVKCF